MHWIATGGADIGKCCAITQRVVTAGRDHAYRRGMLVRQEGQRLCPGYSPQACQSFSRHHYPPSTSANTVNGHGRRRRGVVSQTSPRALPPFRVRMNFILHCGGRMLMGKDMLDRSAQLVCINFEGALEHLSATSARFLHLYERGHHADHAASFVALRTHSSALPRRSRSHLASCARSERTVPRRSGVPPRRE